MKCPESFVTAAAGITRLCLRVLCDLVFGVHLPLSDEDFQQSGALDPLLLCVSSMKLARSMTSEFNLLLVSR